jgi:hypothetical protein
MIWRLRTPQGKKRHGLREQTPEPVFGIIKPVMGCILAIATSCH